MFHSFLNLLNALTWSAFEAFAMISWFDILSGQKITKHKFCMLLLLIYIVSMVSNGVGSPFVRATLASTINIVLLYYIGCRERFWHDSHLVILLCAVVSTLMTYGLMNQVTQLTTLAGWSVQYQVISNLCVNIVTTFVVIMLRCFRFKWVPGEFLQAHMKQLMCLLVISIFLRIWGNYQAYHFARNHYTMSIWRELVWLLMIVAIVLVPMLYRYYEQLQNKVEQHFEALSASQYYVNQLEKQYAEYRFFKHDYKNILASLEYAIQTENMHDIKETYYSVIRRSQLLLPKETMLQLSQLSDIQLRGVILVKYQLAAEHSVNITLSVDKLFDNTSIEKDIDFYRVVGILLDNAIEAVSLTTDKKVSIIFSKDNEIIIVNSYQENIDIHRIEELGYSSKNTHEGIGLSFITRYTMQQPLIEHCTIIENRQFIQKLIVG